MKIDLALKKKLGRYWECTSYVWPYVREHFNSDEGKFIEFLERLDSHDAQKCLYSLFFYWAQNPVREKSNEQRSPNFDVFVYLLTLSVIEFLMQSTKNPWDRIDKFFNKYLNKEEMNFLNKQIKARREGRILKDKAAIRILFMI